MKKIAALTAALLFLFVLAGCCQPSDTNVPDVPDEPSPSKASKIDNIPFADDQLYAVACLGYEEMGNLSAYTESCLDSENLPVHYISPGEYYLVIPRYADMAMRMYRNSMDSTEGTLIYEEMGSRPFIVQCNVSDIFPDVTIQLTYQAETVEFSPHISLKDGSVEVGDRGLDITLPS